VKKDLMIEGQKICGYDQLNRLILHPQKIDGEAQRTVFS
jgi:hypothetical protein